MKEIKTGVCARCIDPDNISFQHICVLGKQSANIGKVPQTRQQIHDAVHALELALLNQLEVSQMELEAKSKKEATRLATQIARDAVREIRFFD